MDRRQPPKPQRLPARRARNAHQAAHHHHRGGAEGHYARVQQRLHPRLRGVASTGTARTTSFAHRPAGRRRPGTRSGRRSRRRRPSRASRPSSPPPRASRTRAPRAAATVSTTAAASVTAAAPSRSWRSWAVWAFPSGPVARATCLLTLSTIRRLLRAQRVWPSSVTMRPRRLGAPLTGRVLRGRAAVETAPGGGERWCLGRDSCGFFKGGIEFGSLSMELRKGGLESFISYCTAHLRLDSTLLERWRERRRHFVFWAFCGFG